MITYENDGMNFLFNIFRTHGSVFPKALLFSVPSSVVSVVFVHLVYNEKALEYFRDKESVMNNNAIWGGFSFLVGFLVVFRTSQAYSRFWEGATQTHKMGAEWFDACSSLMAFCKHSEAEKELILTFQNLLVRLFSMLHAAALGEIEDCGVGDGYDERKAFQFDLIDAESIDVESLRLIHECDAKVELIFQWIQQLVVLNIRNGVLSIPPPILSRSFQEIATGMVHFHESLKISNVPFPFPYAQTCDCLLVLHWWIVPFIVSQWVTKPWWAGLFSFLQVFTLWTLNLIAVELENPFGTDANDIDGNGMQLAMNNSLRLLLRAEFMSLPFCECGPLSQRQLMDKAIEPVEDYEAVSSFHAVWARISNNGSTRMPSSSVRAYRGQVVIATAANARPSARASIQSLSRGSSFKSRTSHTTHSSNDKHCYPDSADAGHWEELPVEYQHEWIPKPLQADVVVEKQEETADLVDDCMGLAYEDTEATLTWKKLGDGNLPCLDGPRPLPELKPAPRACYFPTGRAPEMYIISVDDGEARQIGRGVERAVEPVEHVSDEHWPASTLSASSGPLRQPVSREVFTSTDSYLRF